MVYTGIELGWLSKGDGIPMPRIEFVEWMDYAGGHYFAPTGDVLELADGRELLCDKGIIFISYDPDVTSDEHIIASIAHEYRHHWQWYNFGELHGVDMLEVQPDVLDDWDTMIVAYYSQSYTELDALLFEHRKYPTATSGRSLGLLNHYVYNGELNR